MGRVVRVLGAGKKGAHELAGTLDNDSPTVAISSPAPNSHVSGNVSAAMLTSLEASSAAVMIPAEELASMMIDLQRRSEAGEDVARLVASIASVLVRRRRGRRRRGR